MEHSALAPEPGTPAQGMGAACASASPGIVKHKRLLGGSSSPESWLGRVAPGVLGSGSTGAAVGAAGQVCGAKRSPSSRSPWCCLAAHRGILVFCVHMEQGREVWWRLELLDMNI